MWFATGVKSPALSGVALSSEDAIFATAVWDCRSVSLLDCLPRPPREVCLLRPVLFFRPGFGVRTLSSPSHAAASSPETESLSEEFSLSPSLNQCRFSCSSAPPAVCWRIQPSVMPCPKRLARFARTAAAALISGSRTSGWESRVGGAGRRKGVWSSRRWIGESSEASLLKLWPLELRERRSAGYGEPQGFARERPELGSSGSAELSGGVLSSPRTRSGSLGARRGGSSGDASPSAVEALESAGDAVFGDLYGSQESSRRSRADARGGVCGDSFADDVVAWSGSRSQSALVDVAAQGARGFVGGSAPPTRNQRTLKEVSADESRVVHTDSLCSCAPHVAKVSPSTRSHNVVVAGGGVSRQSIVVGRLSSGRDACLASGGTSRRAGRVESKKRGGQIKTVLFYGD